MPFNTGFDKPKFVDRRKPKPREGVLKSPEEILREINLRQGYDRNKDWLGNGHQQQTKTADTIPSDTTSAGSQSNTNTTKPTPKRQRPDPNDPRFKSGKLGDVGFGLYRGSMLGKGEDPMFRLGSTIGGAIGGLLNKGVAGRAQYEEENVNFNLQTEAELKLQAMLADVAYRNQQKEVLEADQKRKDEDLALKTKKVESAIVQKDLSSLFKLLPTINPESELGAQTRRQVATLSGLDPDEAEKDLSFGIDFKPQTFGDDVVFISKGGVVKQALLDGKPISDLGVEDQLDILAKMDKLQGGESLTRQDLMDAREEAKGILNPKEFTKVVGGKNPKTVMDTQQYNTQVFALAKQIAEARKEAKKVNGANPIPITIRLGDTPITKMIPVRGVSEQPKPEVSPEVSPEVTAPKETAEEPISTEPPQVDPDKEWDDLFRKADIESMAKFKDKHKLTPEGQKWTEFKLEQLKGAKTYASDKGIEVIEAYGDSRTTPKGFEYTQTGSAITYKNSAGELKELKDGQFVDQKDGTLIANLNGILTRVRRTTNQPRPSRR
jgi:hypothetical protein